MSCEKGVVGDVGALLVFGVLVAALFAGHGSQKLFGWFKVAVMATAVAAVHWENGLWVSGGGFEFPLVLAAVAFVVTAIGPGSISLDNLFGIDWASLRSTIGATVVGVLGGLVAVVLPRFTHRTHGSQPHTA